MLKILFSLVLLSSAAYAASPRVLHTFKKAVLTDEFWSEGANFGDFNRDGVNDIVAGPFWYAGPDYKTRHEYAPATASFKPKGSETSVRGIDPHVYSKNFLAFVYDLNKDKWPDILILGFPGEESSWYENPKGRAGHWQRHIFISITDNESPTITDLTGDGKPEIVCNSEGYFGYASPDWSDPGRPWKFHRVTPKGPWQRFTHGMGVGDVNGDGRKDILEKDGWWEQPASLEGDPVWVKHKADFGSGGAQMHVYDVDGDGDNDVITSIHAHEYGLAWFEASKDNGELKFQKHLIINKTPEESPYGVAFSQMHAVDLIDMDGDGLKDIVTGKRYWAHGPTGDPEPLAPAVLYWFKLVRNKDKSVEFIPNKIDDNSGIGTQVVAGLVTKDKLPDIVVGNKKGVFVFTHETKRASKQEWEAAQPKRISK